MNFTESSDRLLHVPAVESHCRMLVLGVGGAGCNIVARMGGNRADGPEMAALNTDTQALSACTVRRCLQIGAATTQGLGAGGDATLGKLAAEENIEQIQELLAGVDLLILVAGLGGGTGTGAAPVIAQAAHRLGALTLGFVTLPFPFEGERRRRQAEDGLRLLRQCADTVVCLPNQRLVELAQEGDALTEAFRKSDEVVGAGVHALWRLLAHAGVINLDFADVRQLAERSGGTCSYGYGEATGPARSASALRALMDSPLLEKGRLLSEAVGLLVNITGGPDLTLADVQGIMGQIAGMVRPGAHLFMGAAVDPTFRERIALTVLATENWMERRENGRAAATAVAPAQATSPGTEAESDEAARNSGRAEQQALNFESTERGRFKNVEPTFYGGEDLDIPTYIRRGVKLSFEK